MVLMSQTTGSYEDVTPDHDGGVLKKLLKAATDDSQSLPDVGDTCYVNYIGTHKGIEFDRNLGSYPYVFKVGEAKVIKGWEIGIKTMRVGEKAEFKIASEYGYGEAGSGKDIPPGATLVFEIELLDVKGSPGSGRQGDADLDRLRLLRQQREEAAKKRLEEKAAKDASKAGEAEKLKAKLAKKKPGGKRK